MKEIKTRMKLHVRHKLKDESPTVWIGKDGLSTQLSVQIDKQLEKNKMVKVKILRTALQDETAKSIAAKAAEATGSSLVEVRGHVFMLYRRRKESQEEKTGKA